MPVTCSIKYPNLFVVKNSMNSEGNIDSLSCLPDEILHHILSLSDLQLFDVVKMSVLSKRWNRLFKTMPYLHFDLGCFYDWHANAVQDITLFERLRRFMNWVLDSRKDSSVVRFRLFSQKSYDKGQVLRWLRAVAKRNVKELEIYFNPLGVFKLPRFIATSESLEVLHIALDYNVLQLPNHISLNRLRRFAIIGVEIRDSDSLERLVSGCRVLETLYLDYCMAREFTSLHVSSTSIKLLHIGFLDNADIGNCEITVSCPNLTKFIYLAPVAKSCILQKASRIEYAQIDLMDIRDILEIPKVGQVTFDIMKNVCNVTTLSLLYKVVPCLWYSIDEMLHCPITFYKVKSLTLNLSIVGIHTQVMFLLVDHCPNLEVLYLICQEWNNPELNEQWQLDHKGIVSWKSHPHLRTIELSAFKGNMNDLDFLKFLLKNASTLQKLNIIWDREEKCPSIIETVSDFPKASLNCMVKFQVRGR